jgi:hypothetical protein
MIIAANVTFPAINTGYSIKTLLEAAGVVDIPPRVCELRVRGAAFPIYLVPAPGPYANTGGIPDQYGAVYDTPTRIFHLTRLRQNAISLEEINLGAFSLSATAQIFAYTL